MELEQLRMFVSAARSGSFSAAGRSLYTSRSTVSRTVSALEKELGVKLISRSNRQLALTGESCCWKRGRSCSLRRTGWR